jgi:Family of unknown function (DUF5678)
MPNDRTQLFTRYKGQWVALDDDETTAIASAPTAKEAHRRALKTHAAPILYRVPGRLDTFVGYEICV